MLHKQILHFSPCATSKNGFKVAVFLPKGTNTPLLKKSDEQIEIIIKIISNYKYKIKCLLIKVVKNVTLYHY